jgi:protease secretion system membrane fusion protein
MASKLQGGGVVGIYADSQELVLPVTDKDTSWYTRLGWWIITAGVGGFFLWASFAPLDKGVPISGTVTVATNRKAIQHLTGGTIEDILVKEGDVVKAGTVLVRMNSVQVKANAGTIRVQYLTARAAEARLIAERDGKKQIVFPAELENMKTDPTVANYIEVQRYLFSSRLLEIQSELAAINENISGLRL